MDFTEHSHWSKRHLKYVVKNFPNNTNIQSDSEVKSLLRQALDKWFHVSSFNFSETSREGDADIVFSFGSVNANGRLAETRTTVAMDAKCEVVFDDSRTWTSDASNDGIEPTLGTPVFILIRKTIELVGSTKVDLLTVAVHEIGHCLGLGHNESGDSIMQSDLTWEASTFLYYMSGRGVPYVDRKKLWNLYPNEWTPSDQIPEIPRGYAIVGFHQEVSDITSHQPNREQYLWGGEGTKSICIADGYCWNRYLNEGDGGKGYARIYLHLKEIKDVNKGTPIVIGGGISFYDLTSKEHTHDGCFWGTHIAPEEGETVTFGGLYGWNEVKKADGYLYFYAIIGEAHGDSAAPFAVLGGHEDKCNSTSALREDVSKWGDEDGGEDMMVVHGRTYFHRYDNAYMHSYLNIAR